MARLKLTFLVLLMSTSAHAADGVDVREWLNRPGVKMLAVEFYATWCGPCKAAVPQWRELHERYRDQGFRLVVVSVQDPDGTCVNPGWNPDDVVCDAEGHLAQAWGVGERLPAAFLWSWRGNLLVRKGHIDEVRRAVEGEIARLPRIALDEEMDRGLRELLRSELAKSGKVDVVAGAAEQQALDEMRRRSHGLSFSAQTACELGQQLAANSLLKATFVPTGSGKRLLVQMFSGETGCLNASAGVFWNEDRPDVSVAEAVSKLIGNLRTTPDLPGSAKAPTVAARDIGQDTADDWQMEGTSGVVVAFETEPVGAVVLWDGQMLCQTTPCSKLVAPGSHKVEFHLESYLPVRESVQVTTRTDGIKRQLTPNFGWITVRTTPSGLPATLNGKPWGTTPLERRQVPSGPHRVLISDFRYVERGREIVLERGKHEVIELDMSPREGGLQILARDRQGNDLRATVLVDGREVGKTPYSEKVIIGEHRVTVVHSGTRWDQQVTIREREVAKLEAVLAVGPEMVPVVQPRPERTATRPDATDRPAKEKRVFHLGASLAEGVLMADGQTARSGVSGTLAMWLKWNWFRWEPLSLGMSFEGAKPVLLGTGTAWDLTKGLYLRNVFLAAFAQGKKYWGLLYGAGYGFSLGSGWSLDMEVNWTLWPGDVLVQLFEGRVGLRVGF